MLKLSLGSRILVLLFLCQRWWLQRLKKLTLSGSMRRTWWDIRELREGKVAAFVLVAFLLLFLWVLSELGESPVVPITLEVLNTVEEGTDWIRRDCIWSWWKEITCGAQLWNSLLQEAMKPNAWCGFPFLFFLLFSFLAVQTLYRWECTWLIASKKYFGGQLLFLKGSCNSYLLVVRGKLFRISCSATMIYEYFAPKQLEMSTQEWGIEVDGSLVWSNIAILVVFFIIFIGFYAVVKLSCEFCGYLNDLVPSQCLHFCLHGTFAVELVAVSLSPSKCVFTGSFPRLWERLPFSWLGIRCLLWTRAAFVQWMAIINSHASQPVMLLSIKGR